MNRRRFIGALAVGGVGAVAGCLSDTEATTFSAAPARVSEDAAAEAGYEYRGTKRWIDETDVGGETVEVTSYCSVYDRSIDLPAEQFGEEPLRAGAFGVFAAPQVSVSGEEFDPLGEFSNRQLAERAQNHYADLEIVRAVGGRALEALGERFSLQSYEGTATLQETYEIGVVLDTIQRTHEGDYVALAAVYPTDDVLSGASEEGRIDTLIRGLVQYDDLEVEIVEDDDTDGSGD
ncbi:DUF6517 family protein [Natrinema salaciae]|uniref:Tat (Twin-arginine translocation) pathway signal sequence n=1 Tax=Natrinema salaciae TaxID=1186196 RepID=A0A1H9EF67_9EURY|nr:DUF6517 family protein [Natrinema salaciae]SEQ23658.1 Tat (twin-arginine translocation) pathway signal sequence [Natrinema salaciae]